MSSFTKRSQSSIPGTRTSLQNGLLLTSTGNPSLDHILGGGLPIGSIIAIEEDKFTVQSKVLAKYFLAEGIYCGHSTFFGSLDDDPKEMIKKLPKLIDAPEDELINNQIKARIAKDEMRIAWRYNELPKVNSEQSVSISIGHNFNLTERIDEKLVENADITYWNEDCVSSKDEKQLNTIFRNLIYHNILENIHKKISEVKFSKKQGTNKENSILRICFTSIGSPIWYQENFIEDILKFLLILKSYVRNYNSVCFLTIPMHLLEHLDGKLLARIRNIFDYSIQLETFAGSDKETNPLFKEYHGLLHVRKIAAFNTLATVKPTTTDLAFKLKRKKFVIEKLHLPPELSETEDKFTEQKSRVNLVSCADINKKGNLDF